MLNTWKTRAAAGFVVVLSAGMTFGVAGPASAASNAENAKACSQNWQNLQGESGPFTSLGECVSSSAQGGALFSPVVSFSANPIPETTKVVFSGSGFHPNSDGTLSVTLNGEFYFSQFQPTDANGAFSTVETSTDLCPADFVYSYTDASGVTASAPLTVTCSTG